MGRSAKKRSDGEIPQSSRSCIADDSSFRLLRLPNELFEMILSYLSSSYIVQSFFEINSNRIQTIISKYVVHLDLVPVQTDEEQWIKRYLLDQCRLSQCILSLRLSDRQMKLLSKYNLLFIQLQSLHIVNIQDNNVLHIDLRKIAPFLHSLSLEYSSDDMSHDDLGCLPRILFNDRGTWQQQLERLSINKIHLRFGFQSLQIMTNLRHLTINIRYENQLFDLCFFLPRLQSLDTHVLCSSSAVSDQSMNISNGSVDLKKLAIGGHFSSYSSLYKFILTYKTSVEDLILKNIHHPDLVTGHQLQTELIKHLPSLLRFQFQFQFPVNIEEFHQENYIKTFHWTPVVVYSKMDEESTMITVSSQPA